MSCGWDSTILFELVHLTGVLGILIHDTDQKKFVLDFTPRHERDTGRLYCMIRNVLSG